MRERDPLDRPFPIGGLEAKRYGAVTTLENSAGKILVLHRAGGVREAVDDAYATATALDETFRVVCISTPTTIYTDLQGARKPSTRAVAERFAGSQTPQIPELSTLGGKRRYMLHPRLWGSGETKYRVPSDA